MKVSEFNMLTECKDVDLPINKKFKPHGLKNWRRRVKIRLDNWESNGWTSVLTLTLLDDDGDIYMNKCMEMSLTCQNSFCFKFSHFLQNVIIKIITSKAICSIYFKSSHFDRLFLIPALSSILENKKYITVPKMKGTWFMKALITKGNKKENFLWFTKEKRTIPHKAKRWWFADPLVTMFPAAKTRRLYWHDACSDFSYSQKEQSNLTYILCLCLSAAFMSYGVY